MGVAKDVKDSASAASQDAREGARRVKEDIREGAQKVKEDIKDSQSDSKQAERDKVTFYPPFLFFALFIPISTSPLPIAF